LITEQIILPKRKQATKLSVFSRLAPDFKKENPKI